MGRAPSLPGGEGGIFQQIYKEARPIWGAPLPSPGVKGGYFNEFAKGRAPYGARLFPPRGRRGGISTMPACTTS